MKSMMLCGVAASEKGDLYLNCYNLNDDGDYIKLLLYCPRVVVLQ